MRIWGIGSTWDKYDKTQVFSDKSLVQIGWSQKEAPALYDMLQDIELGDIVYMKSFIIRGALLRIKQVGYVTCKAHYVSFAESACTEKDGDIKENYQVVSVKWAENSAFKHPLQPEERRYNVYSTTLYQERNPKIIEEINKRMAQ